MVGTVSVNPAPSVPAARDEVVEFVSRLIRFDTTNTGEPETTVGEADCARWVAAQLEAVGYETEYVESGAPGRGNVITRLAGADPSRGALLIHGHLDVVPAEPADWSVHPFSGAVEDGYVWGRGAVDMKNMIGMMIAVARRFKRAGVVPPRDLVFAFVADEEAGGRFGAQWLVEHRPDLFAGVTEAIGEVGGFVDRAAPRRRRAPTVSDRDRREGHALDAVDRPRARRARLDDPRRQRGHRRRRGGRGAGPPPVPAGAHRGGGEFLAAVAEETGHDFDPASPDLEGTIAKLGPIARLIGATLRDTVNPTMLAAGYKANVIPRSRRRWWTAGCCPAGRPPSRPRSTS